jgi:hypothetical protein
VIGNEVSPITNTASKSALTTYLVIKRLAETVYNRSLADYSNEVPVIRTEADLDDYISI